MKANGGYGREKEGGREGGRGGHLRTQLPAPAVFLRLLLFHHHHHLAAAAAAVPRLEGALLAWLPGSSRSSQSVKREGGREGGSEGGWFLIERGTGRLVYARRPRTAAGGGGGACSEGLGLCVCVCLVGCRSL